MCFLTSYLELRKTFRDLVKCKMLTMLISKNRHLIALSKKNKRNFVIFIDFAPNVKVEKPNNCSLSVLFSAHAYILSSFHSLFFPRYILLPYFFPLIKNFKVPEVIGLLLKVLLVLL